MIIIIIHLFCLRNTVREQFNYGLINNISGDGQATCEDDIRDGWAIVIGRNKLQMFLLVWRVHFYLLYIICQLMVLISEKFIF